MEISFPILTAKTGAREEYFCQALHAKARGARPRNVPLPQFVQLRHHTSIVLTVLGLEETTGIPSTLAMTISVVALPMCTANRTVGTLSNMVFLTAGVLA